jgi:ribosomal-protein-alanine N-acetyltransferase
VSLVELHSARLLINSFTIDDITPEYVSWLNDPEVTKFSRQRHLQHTYETCLRYFSQYQNTVNEFLLLHEVSSCCPIGTMTFNFDLPRSTVDIGILIGSKSHWGRGYGNEAWETALSHFSSDSRISKVTGGCHAENSKMIKIMRSAGMRRVFPTKEEANREWHEDPVVRFEYRLSR